MSGEKEAFDAQINSLKVLTNIYRFISPLGRFENAEHILRSEFVLMVSAFDNYLHQITHRKLTEMFFSTNPAELVPDGLRMKANGFQAILREADANEQRALFETALRKRLAEDSFQSPKSVEYVMGLIQVKNFWKRVSDQMNATPDDVRNRLALIVHRRNCVAHESDIDPAMQELRQITVEDVDDCRKFLSKLVECMDSFI